MVKWWFQQVIPVEGIPGVLSANIKHSTTHDDAMLLLSLS